MKRLAYYSIGPIIGLILARLTIALLHAQAPAYWFNLTNGDTNCRADWVNTSPLQFSYYCGNSRGATAGSYTAASAATATDAVTVGLSGPVGTVLCIFAVNATANPVSIGSFGPTPIPAGSISWQCSAQGQSAGNAGTVSIAKGALK